VEHGVFLAVRDRWQAALANYAAIGASLRVKRERRAAQSAARDEATRAGGEMQRAPKTQNRLVVVMTKQAGFASIR